MNTPRQHASHALIASDAQMSVLYHFHQRQETFTYGPYGTRSTATLSRALLGFNGQALECLDSYLLGIGYRDYYPKWMRFRSPDSSSPFGEGGLNAYGYCEGDPVNYADPLGHSPKQRAKAYMASTGLELTTLKNIRKYWKETFRLEKKTIGVKNNRDSLAATPEMKEKSPNLKTKYLSDGVKFDMVGSRLNFRKLRQENHEGKRKSLLEANNLTEEGAAPYDSAAKNALHIQFGHHYSQSEIDRLSALPESNSAIQKSIQLRLENN